MRGAFQDAGTTNGGTEALKEATRSLVCLELGFLMQSETQ